MKTILFIEDEPALQKTLGEGLRQKGYEVISALDGELGLNLAKEKKPELILLDLVLPKMSGFDVLKLLKANEGTKRIPVIVLTNLEGMEDIEKILAAGAMTYLVKTNYRLEELIEKIEQAMEN